MSKKIGILFDLDGTLLDTLQDLTDATNYALRKFSLPERSVSYIRSILGNGAQRQIALAMPGKADDPGVEQVLAVYKEYYADHCQIKTRPYDGVVSAMEELSKKYPLAVVSNKPHFAVKPLCETISPVFIVAAKVRSAPESQRRIWYIDVWKTWAWTLVYL